MLVREIVCGRCGCVTEVVFMHRRDKDNPDNNVYQMGCCEEIVRGSEFKTFIRTIEIEEDTH